MKENPESQSGTLKRGPEEERRRGGEERRGQGYSSVVRALAIGPGAPFSSAINSFFAAVAG